MSALEAVERGDAESLSYHRLLRLRTAGLVRYIGQTPVLSRHGKARLELARGFPGAR